MQVASSTKLTKLAIRPCGNASNRVETIEPFLFDDAVRRIWNKN